jgi:hypothetical protein
MPTSTHTSSKKLASDPSEAPPKPRQAGSPGKKDRLRVRPLGNREQLRKVSKQRTPLAAQIALPDSTGPPLSDCHTVAEFCSRNRISLAFYYKLRAQGLGPREIRLGTKVLITKEAAEAWRRAQEAASST